MNKTILTNTKEKKQTSVINHIVLVFLMYMLFFRQVYSYLGMPYVTTKKGSFVYEQASLSSSITMFLSVVAVFCIFLLFFNTRFYAEGTYLIISLVLIAGVCLWSFFAVKEVGLGNLLYSSMPPHVYITALMFCIGMREELFKVFLKHAKILGILSILACIITSVLFFNSHSGAVLADSSVLRYYIQGFWLICICSFSEEKSNKAFVYPCIMFFAVMSFSFSSRSWLIQSIIWLIVYTYFSQKNRSVLRLIKTIIIALVLIGIIYVFMKNFFPDLMKILIEKMSPKDTRALQYADLFAQTDLSDFIIGNGYSFTYNSSIQGGEYNYIDNAYLLMLVRYGLLIGITYPLMFFVPAVKARFSKHTMPIIMWLMALGGLSIFCATIFDLKSIALPVAAGHCMHLASHKRKQLSEEGNDSDNE